MKRRVRNRVAILAVLLAGVTVHAELKVVVNFEGMSGSPFGKACNGALGGVMDTQSDGTGNVDIGTVDGSVAMLVNGLSSGADPRAAGFNRITNPIEDSETGIAFFRFSIRSSAGRPVRTHVGLIADATDNPINGTSGQDPMTIPAGCRLVDNGTGFNVVTQDGKTVLKPGLVRTQWYNVWIVANNAADTFDLYLSTAAGPGGVATLPNPEDLVKSGIPFASPTSAPLTGMIFANPAGTGQAERINVDDIWWDGDQGLAKSNKAAKPSPAYAEADVARDVILSWAPGPFAAKHDVYFGTVMGDVSAASGTNPLGVLVSRGQDANTYDPTGLLALGQTYYWRVDEVNAPPDSTIYKGGVWTFTTEPVSFAVRPVAATASSSQNTDSVPGKTMDGSGLNASDQHGAADTATMWLSSTTGPQPTWIQYEFDKVYKLHQMWVWNYNQALEPDLGLGAKDVTVETSTDGTTWTALAGVSPFAQATGKADYVHNTTVDLGGTLAKYVKITINSNFRGILSQYGLSEVRFFQIPVRARRPQPASGTANVALDTLLSWRAGREAVRHEVYLGTDPNAVRDATTPLLTVTEAGCALSSLAPEYGRTYYWKISEVNDAAAPTSWNGEVWSFSTVGYAVVDDFEAYDDACARIFFTWVDGYGHSGSPDCSVVPYGGNGTGSAVGNVQAPFAERTLVQSGRQSMPMTYDNSTGKLYSETQREWTTPQAWSTGGANTLVLYLRGEAPAFLETSPGSIVMNGMGTDIYNTADQGRFAYKQLSGDGSITARVDSLANTNAWAKAGVMIRGTLDTDSTWAYVLYGGTNGAHFQARLATGVAAVSDSAVATPAQGAARVPVWVRVERKGSQFNGYYATDAAGTAWTPMAWNPQTVTMAGDVYIGLAVTSHAANVVCGARFSSVSTTGKVTGSWQQASLGVTQSTAAGNAPEAFYVAVEDGAKHLKVVSNPDSVAISTGTWEQWQIPLSTFTSAGVNLGSVKKFYIGVGDRNAPKAGGVGKLYIDDIRLTRIATPQ